MKTDWLMMMSNQRITLNKNPFVRCIAFSLLVFLGLWTVQHFWLIGLRRYRTLDLGTLNKVISGNVNADILVVGSSRAQHGFDPRIISRQTKKSVYNIGLDGTQIDLQAALFFTYLRHNRKPEFLILSLDVHNLSSTRDRDIYHSGLYMADLDEPDLFPAMSNYAMRRLVVSSVESCPKPCSTVLRLWNTNGQPSLMSTRNSILTASHTNLTMKTFK